MTSEPQGSTHVPRGFRTYLLAKQLVIECPDCHRKWKGDRIAADGNRQFLLEHLSWHAKDSEGQLKPGTKGWIDDD